MLTTTTASTIEATATTNCHRNNTCLCQGLPGWLAAAVPLDATSGTALDGSVCNPGCMSEPPPAAWMADVPALMALVAAMAPTSDQAWLLGSWDPSVPPCTSDASTGDCALCGPWDGDCAALAEADGVRRCNWRLVECRNRRVVSLLFDQVRWTLRCRSLNSNERGALVGDPTWGATHACGRAPAHCTPLCGASAAAAQVDVTLRALPPALAGAAALEVLDLGGAWVQGGPLPLEYTAWANLTVFRCEQAQRGGVGRPQQECRRVSAVSGTPC